MAEVQAKNATYIASMTKSPWAKLTTFIMPQISVRPEENSDVHRPQQQAGDDDLRRRINARMVSSRERASRRSVHRSLGSRFRGNGRLSAGVTASMSATR